MPNKEDRYRDLLGRIDGGTRKKQLEEELKQLQGGFMDAHGNVERQAAFIKKHELELAAAQKKEGADTQHISREAILARAREQLPLMQINLEHLADEIEKLEGRIKEIAEAGLPKVKEAEEEGS